MHTLHDQFDLLTMAEVAQLLHCSKAHVCNAVAGKLRGCPPIPSVRMGRRMVQLPSDAPDPRNADAAVEG